MYRTDMVRVVICPVGKKLKIQAIFYIEIRESYSCLENNSNK